MVYNIFQFITSNFSLELITTLEEDNNVLRTQVNDFIKEKKQRDNQIDEFTTAIDTKLNKWQVFINFYVHYLFYI